MARRRWTRWLAWTGIALGAIAGLALGVLLVLTRTSFGRERVRQIVAEVANRGLLGSLHLGALRFGPGCALAIDSAVLRDARDSLLASVGPARGTCRLGALLRRRLVITSLEIDDPHVVLRQGDDGEWNWSRLTRPDASPPAARDSAQRGPPAVVVDGSVRIGNGTVALRVPGQPRRTVTSLAIDLPHVRTGAGDTAVVARLDRIALALDTPAVALHRVAGRIAIVGSSARFDLPTVSVGRSGARVAGRIDWSGAGTPAIVARAVVDTLALGDLRPLSARVPADGGGRLEIIVQSPGGASPTMLAVTGLDLRTLRSSVRGEATIRLGGSERPGVRAATLDLAPLHTELLRVVAADALPAGLRGALVAHVVLRGGDENRLHVDTLDAGFTPEGNARARSRVRGSGVVALAGEAPAADLRLEVRPLALAAFAGAFPALASVPPVQGQIDVQGTLHDASLAATLRSAAGSAVIDGRYRQTPSGIIAQGRVQARNLDVAAADPRAAATRAPLPPSRLSGDIDVDLRLAPSSPPRGTAEVTRLTGTVGSLTLEPSGVRLTLTDSRVVAESLHLVTSAGTARAHGALGLRPHIRDTLHVEATASLAELARALRPDSGRDSTPSRTAEHPGQRGGEGPSGALTARARVIGSLDSLEIDGEAEGTAIVAPAIRASRAHVAAAIQGLPRTPRGRVALRLDSVSAAGRRFSSVTADARSARAGHWRVALGTGADDRPGGAALGAVARRGDTVAVALDSLALHVPGTSLRLTRPTRALRARDGSIVLDSVELRGERGTLFQLAGVIRDTGAIAATLRLRDAPVPLAGPGGPGDTIRAVGQAVVDIAGTARVPRATMHLRLRVAEGDSLGIDSVVADASHADGRTQLTAGVHGSARALLTARVAVPFDLSLTPFRATIPDEPISGDISIDSIALAELTRYVPGVQATDGVLRTHLTVSGTARKPRAVGDVAVLGATAAVSALGLELRGANLAVDLTEDRLRIREASVRAGRDPEGRAELSGEVGLGDNATMDLRIRAATMPVIRRPETAELDLSADLRLAGPNRRPVLSGRITVERGTIRLPDMGRAGVVGVDDTAFVRLLDSLANKPATRTQPSLLQRLEIGDVTVTMGPSVWLRSAEADVQLGGSIDLERATPQAGTPGLPVVLRGMLETRRGTYRLNVGAITRSFQLEEGSVQFTGEADMNPRLDINATYGREGIDEFRSTTGTLRVRAHVGGTLERPVLTLSGSDSALSQAELMSYLVTGQAHFAAGDVDEGVVTSELVASATGAVAQRLAGGFFDVVDVTAGATSASGDDAQASSAADAFAASRLGLGKQLSNRVFVKLDAGLCALTGSGASTDLAQTMGVSLDYRFRAGLLGSLSSAPSTNGAACANQAAGRTTALAPRQWGLDIDRLWRF